MCGNGNYNKSGHLQVLPMYAARMSNLPPYLFARIDEMKAEQQKKVLTSSISGSVTLTFPPRTIS